VLNIPCRIALGGLVYRIGPDPVRDVVAFCGPGNVGCMRGPVLAGHTWLEVGDDVAHFLAAQTD
jgi:hypothetical protein